jgi:hypothetical protein
VDLFHLINDPIFRFLHFLPFSQDHGRTPPGIDTLIFQRNLLRSEPPKTSSDQIAKTEAQGSEEQCVFPQKQPDYSEDNRYDRAKRDQDSNDCFPLRQESFKFDRGVWKISRFFHFHIPPFVGWLNNTKPLLRFH